MDKLSNSIAQVLEEHHQVVHDMRQNPSTVIFLENVIKTMVHCIQRKGRIWFAGNGGSAADAQHLAAELSGKFYLKRAPLPAEALHVNSSFLTAVANDYDFAEVFARAIEAHGTPGDVLILLSTSGQSTNVIKAANKARDLGVTTIAITGIGTVSRLSEIVDYHFSIPSRNTARIQEGSLIMGHLMCQEVERILFGDGLG